MRRRYLGAGCAVLAALLLSPLAAHAGAVDTVTVTGQRFSEDACLHIAKAKYAQWAQARVMRTQTETFADGTQKNSETVFTENTVYNLHYTIWVTGQLSARQRTAEAPAVLEKNMDLSGCSSGEQAEEGGQKTTVYTFLSGKDDDAAQGKIWIADATGLPVREEMALAGKAPEIPVALSARYTYGADVQIPRMAELAESVRLTRTACVVRELQNPALHGGC
jgi:hypothetical protein